MSDLEQIKKLLMGAIEKKNQNTEAEMRAKLMTGLGADIVSSLAPLLKQLAGSKEDMIDALKQAISEIQVNADIPDIVIPEIKMPKLPDFPKIPAPVVNYRPPDIHIPEIKMPGEMDIKGWVNMMGYDKGLLLNPLPVQIRDAQGNPLNVNALLAALKGSSQGGGSMGSGKTDFFKLNYTTSDPLPVTLASAAGATSATNIVDSSGVGYSGSNPVPVTIVSGAASTSAVNIVDSSGVAFGGANPISVVFGANASAYAVGPAASGASDDGSNPVQQGGIVRTTNPTKNTDGQVVKASFDAVGRQVMRPLQVRGLIQTAYVQITGGTETTLRAGVAGAYLDLIYLLAANNSDAAVSIDIRAVTAGGVVMTLQVPANGVAGLSLPVPIPQQDTGNNWTVDGPDISGTTVSFSALFSQEV